MLLKYIMIIVIALIFLIISIIINTILTFYDYKQTYILRNQLSIWVSNGCNGKGPNSYEFKQLFKRAFPNMAGDRDTIITQFQPLIKEETVNTVDCFPSNYKELIKRHFALLNHMCDIFQYKYKQIYDPIYWLRMIKSLIFLPGNVINYLGTHSIKTERAVNAIWWITWIIPIIIKFIINLL